MLVRVNARAALGQVFDLVLGIGPLCFDLHLYCRYMKLRMQVHPVLGT